MKIISLNRKHFSTITPATMTPIALLLILLIKASAAAEGGGRWELLQPSIGIVAMHMQLLHHDAVAIFDRTDFGLSNLTLPNGRCRHDPTETTVKIDCTAHSVEYDVATNTFRALFVQTNTWCSSGSVSANGTLFQTGGDNDGKQVVRTLQPCGGCDWVEHANELAVRRWYATNHPLPDGRQIIVGGDKQHNYEFYPSKMKETFYLPFLEEMDDPGLKNNLYPFVFLNVDGNLFIFANNRAILLNYTTGVIVRNYSTIPGGDPRNYPSTGSAVLLPLSLSNSSNVEAEVMICGGAPAGSLQKAKEGTFLRALNSCARMKITNENPRWKMETMPGPRVMSDMLLLPTGDVLIINGAAEGVAGWGLARTPVLKPLLYHTSSHIFEEQNGSSIPRMYHSTAVLLRDGRVLVAGSNPHLGYDFSNAIFPTELRLEAFSPYYLDAQFDDLCPTIVEPSAQLPNEVTYGQDFKISFQLKSKLAPVLVTLLAPPFNTHSFSMSQRLLVLKIKNFVGVGESSYEVEVTAPPSPTLAPAGYYLLFVVHQAIPSKGIWIRIV